MTDRRSPRRIGALLAAAVLSLGGIAACGDDDVETSTGADDTTEDSSEDSSEDTMTDPDSPDTSADDGGIDAPDDTADYPMEAARESARELLGVAEEELPPEVRISRRGDETFMLTEDYVIGRRTVELDEQGGTYVVTSVTIELPGGPETFTADGS